MIARLPGNSDLRIHWPADGLPETEESCTALAALQKEGKVCWIGASTKLPPDDCRSNSPEFQEPNLSENLKLARRLRELAGRRGSPPGALAAAWTPTTPALTGAIIGARNARQVQEIFPHGDLVLTTQEPTELVN